MNKDKRKLHNCMFSDPKERQEKVVRIKTALEENEYFFWIVNTLFSIGPDNWETLAVWLRRSGENCFRWFFPGCKD